MNITPQDAPAGRRPHGPGEGWVRGGLLLVGVIGIVLLFLSPYVSLLPFVGSFPAEDAREVLPGSYLVEALCLPERGDPATQPVSTPAPPALKVEQGLAPMPRGLFEKSRSFYFSERTGKVIALDDDFDEGEVGKLWMLETQRSVSRKALLSFLAEADRYYVPCGHPAIDRGLTEGYWATKGASVLHHWVHLYEGGLSGSAHVQYGYALPWSVHRILEASGSLGPTSFVRLSWFAFAACGLAYIALFLHLFRSHPWLALAALIVKIHFFVRIGPFALLLAPGFHWYRELVLVALPALLAPVASSWSAGGWRSAWPRLLAAGAGLLACLLLEPTFFLVAVLCALLALLWGNFGRIADFTRAHRRAFLILLLALAAALLALVILESSNLAYIAQKLRGDDLVTPEAKYLKRTLAVCAAAVVFLLFLRGRPQTVLQGYFALVALFSSLYYLITPDVFHFYKFGEYMIPFTVGLVGLVIDRYGGWVTSHVALPRRSLAVAGALGFVALAVMTAGRLRTPPAEWERRIKDSFGAPYFKAAPFTINGRLIRADMSERLAEHLREFPAATRFDFLLTPFDKYVTFLYDRTSGFGAPDVIAWLDSSAKLARALRLTAGSDRPVRVLLDEAVLDVDTRAGIQASHPVLGSLHLASKLNLKARLRAAELAAELLARCTEEERPGAKGWRLLRCGGGR